jgi:hypothetical protein
MSADATYHLKGTLRDDMSLTFDYANAFKSVFAYMIGKDIDIQITILRKNRTNRQNRYIHGVIVPVVQQWLKEVEGWEYTHDQVYGTLRTELGDKAEITEIQGKQVITMTGKRFSKMDTKEFALAVDELIRIYAEKGCVIPEPREECFVNDFVNDKDHE